MPPRYIRHSWAILALIAAGCSVGPNFIRPPAPAVNGYTHASLPAETSTTADVTGGNTQHYVQNLDIPGQWWTLFHSEPLNALINEALKNNADLKTAQAGLKQAQENFYAQEGAYFPQIAANFTSSRYKNAVQPSPTLATYVPYFNLFTPQVSISYLLDIWGLNRRQAESLQAVADAERFQVEATYLTLTSNLVAAVVQEASLRDQIAANEEIIRVETEAQGIVQKQLDLGQIAGADLAAQKAVLAQAQAQLPPLRKQLAIQRDLLTALIGRYPSQEPAAEFDLASLTLPKELPVSLPAKLVEQRPDIRSAEAQLHAASAQVGVAIANMLPQISLTGNIGSTAISANELFQSGNGFWQISGSLTQPIFEGGALYHKTLAARAAFDQAASQYQSTVIQAFQNVADALRALQHDADTLKAQSAAEQAALESFSIARKQLTLGSIGYIGLLNAEQIYQQAVINRVQAQASRYADTAALFQALGGGWWNRTDSAPS